MYCGRCGSPMEDEAKFCPKCGLPVDKDEQVRVTAGSSVAPAYSQVAVKKSSNGVKIALVIGCICMAFFMVAVSTVLVVVAVIKSSHDLSGTYTYDGMFPITTITFYKDGTFTARCDYYEYDTGAVYHGKYSKHGNTYSIRFTGAKTSSSNAVSNFMDEEIGRTFELSARKNNDYSMDIWVSGGTAYAWYGTTRTFYKY